MKPSPETMLSIICVGLPALGLVSYSIIRLVKNIIRNNKFKRAHKEDANSLNTARNYNEGISMMPKDIREKTIAADIKVSSWNDDPSSDGPT